MTRQKNWTRVHCRCDDLGLPYTIESKECDGGFNLRVYGYWREPAHATQKTEERAWHEKLVAWNAGQPIRRLEITSPPLYGMNDDVPLGRLQPDAYGFGDAPQ